MKELLSKELLWVFLVIILVFGVAAAFMVYGYSRGWEHEGAEPVPKNALGPGTLILDQIQSGDGEFTILYWEYADDGTQWVTITSKDGLYSWTQELKGVQP